MEYLTECSRCGGGTNSPLGACKCSLKMEIDAPGIQTAIAKRVLDDIDAYCAHTYDGGHRKHLGASLIGRDCSRFLWYVFRWVKHEKHDGRKQRLFNRGHREEARFIEWLEGIGCTVYAYDLESDPLMFVVESGEYFKKSQIAKESNLIKELAVPVTGTKHIQKALLQGLELNQYRVSGCNGHFGGSLDCIIVFPERYRIAKAVLGEFKTNGTGSGFNKLGESGMAVAKPEHFAQTSIYGKEYNFEYVLYMNINKNDDSLHVELCKLDHREAEILMKKAENIILAKVPPARISQSETFFKCKYCHFAPICFHNEPAEKNCRSCGHSTPIESGQWHCGIYNAIIPAEFIAVGCDQHSDITKVKKI